MKTLISAENLVRLHNYICWDTHDVSYNGTEYITFESIKDQEEMEIEDVKIYTEGLESLSNLYMYVDIYGKVYMKDSDIENARSMLFGQHCETFEAEPLPMLTDATNMFEDNERLWSVSFSNLQSLKKADGMFNYCVALEEVDLPTLYSLESADGMFVGCNNLKDVTLSMPALKEFGDDTNQRMFRECDELKDIRFTNLDSLEIARYAFTQLGVQSVELADMPKLRDATGMFYECAELQYFNIGKLPALEYAEYMFADCTNLDMSDKLVFESLRVADNMFSNSGIETAFIWLKDMPCLVSSNNMFDYCNALTCANIKGLPKLVRGKGMFCACVMLNDATLEDLPSLEDARKMFEGCMGLRKVTLTGLPKLKDVKGMFSDCDDLESVTIDKELYDRLGTEMFAGVYTGNIDFTFV